jgi:hypothetical protein
MITVSEVGSWDDNTSVVGCDYSVHLYFRVFMPEIKNADPASPVACMHNADR